MIEERVDRIPLQTRVFIKELQASGHIYERGQDGGHTVYGIRLDDVAFPKNFVATEVWHCERESLELA